MVYFWVSVKHGDLGQSGRADNLWGELSSSYHMVPRDHHLSGIENRAQDFERGTDKRYIQLLLEFCVTEQPLEIISNEHQCKIFSCCKIVFYCSLKCRLCILYISSYNFSTSRISGIDSKTNYVQFANLWLLWWYVYTSLLRVFLHFYCSTGTQTYITIC